MQLSPNFEEQQYVPRYDLKNTTSGSFTLHRTASLQLLETLGMGKRRKMGRMNGPMSFILCLLSSGPHLQKCVCLQIWTPTSHMLNKRPTEAPARQRSRERGQPGTVLGSRGPGQSLLKINSQINVTGMTFTWAVGTHLVGKRRFLYTSYYPQQASEIYFCNSFS